MQQRESSFTPRSDLEALLSRTDDAAIDYVTDQLLDGGDCSSPPPRTTADASPVPQAEPVEAG
jgi:hypothetical protein